MANLNKVFLIGNLTRDPELRYTPSGTAVVDLGMAINRQWTSQGGEKKDETCFVDLEAWGRSAEVISEYCRKGRPLFVEGRLKLNTWEGRDGQRRSKLRVVVENFQFLGSPSGRKGEDAAAGGGQRADGAQGAAGGSPAEDAPGGPPEQAGGEAKGEFQVDDEIPF